jgi:hypothetical protein
MGWMCVKDLARLLSRMLTGEEEEWALRSAVEVIGAGSWRENREVGKGFENDACQGILYIQSI